MRYRRIGATLMALALVAGCAAAQLVAQQRDAELLLQRAMHAEQVEGDLEQAMELYRKLVEEHGTNRAVAARALLNLGHCYEKLGHGEAMNAYQRLLTDYADQAEIVTEARARLAALRAVARSRETSGLVVRRVWEGRGVAYSGDVSSDGRYLAYVDWSTGNLAVRDLASGESRRITNWGDWEQWAYQVTFSPDDSLLAYSWSNEDYLCDLRTIGLDGSGPTVLYANEDLESIHPRDWSPDGTHLLLLVSHKDDTHEIALISVADGSLRVVKNLGWRQPNRMYFSPDGSYIAYDLPQDEDSPERDIYVVTTDGREAPLVAHPADDYVLGWEPSGHHLLFASDRSGTVGIWVVPVADGTAKGDPELIRSDVSRVMPIGFARDGSFHYGLNVSWSDVYVATFDTTSGQLLEPPTRMAGGFEGSNDSPEWSPDGRYVAYVSVRGSPDRGGGATYLIIRSVETGDERTLSPQLVGYGNVWGMRWSPDGRFILALGRDPQNRIGVYRIDVQSGEAIPIVHGHGACLGPAVWSRDGATLVCNHYDQTAKSSQLLTIDVETGRVQELYRATHPSGFHGPLAISPDGTTLAFRMGRLGNEGAHISLVVMSVSGGQPRRVIDLGLESGTVIIEWSVDGQELIYEERLPESGQRIWRVPIAGGNPREIDFGMERGAADFGHGIINLRVHPDGRRVAFTVRSAEAEVWVMEDFLPAGTKRH